MANNTPLNTKITVGLLLNWVFGVLLTFIGVILIFSELIPGFVLFVISSILLPPTLKKIEQKGNFKLTKPIKTVIIVVGLIIFGATIDTSSATNINEQNKQEVSKPKQQDIALNEENSQKDTEQEFVEPKQQDTTINEEEPQKDAEQEKKTYYLVTNVVDGDTMDIKIDEDTQRLRLIGLDTPETKDPRKPVQCFGIEASNKAKELLLNKKVKIETDPTQTKLDKYNRLLVYLYREDGLFYNKWMIENGYAHEYTYNFPYKYQDEFKEAETKARENKRGFWADGVCEEEEIVDTNNTENTNNTKEEEVVDVNNTENENNTVKDEGSEEAKQGECYCLDNKYNCSDFSSHQEAQIIYECCGGVNNDIHQLDRDKDGSACESLP